MSCRCGSLLMPAATGRSMAAPSLTGLIATIASCTSLVAQVCLAHLMQHPARRTSPTLSLCACSGGSGMDLLVYRHEPRAQWLSG